MRELLKKLPAGVEFAVVVVVAFGYVILGSVLSALQPAHGAMPHTDASLINLLIYEISVIAVLSAFLAARGWSLEKVGLTPSLIDTGLGVALFFVNMLIWYGVWYMTAALSPQTIQAMADTTVITQGISPTWAVLVSLVNPIFEEVFVCGYVVAALKRDESPWMAINASVAIRLAYHLYQGPLGVLSVIPMGLLCAYWFARTGRLWPIVVAHTLADLLALLSAANR